MATPREWMHRLRATLWRGRSDHDLEEELQLHLELAAEGLQRQGELKDEARRAARLQSGSVAQSMESMRNQRGLPWLEDLGRDLRYALRTVAKAPGFAAVVVLTLGLGIGVNTTVFTFVNAILLRGLPFDRPDRIVSLTTNDVNGRALGVSRLDLDDWREQARSVSGLSMFQFGIMNVSDEGRPADMFRGTYGSANMFAVVGARPLLGRDFQPADDRPNADPAVILSYGAWTTRYGGDSTTIGRTIRVNGVASTVIGVMPRGFRFPNNSDLWMPWWVLSPAIRTAPRQVRNFSVVGRLASGVTLAQARTELDTIGARLAWDFPTSNKNLRPAVQPYDDGSNSQWLPWPAARTRLIFYSLWGAVAFVLLIACANVANLLLVRASRRAREVAVRLSLGAGRWRVVRQLLVEGLVLSIVSGVLGLGLSIAGVRLFDAMLSSAVSKPSWMTFPIDVRVLAFLATICVTIPLVFSVAPALHISKTDIHEALKEAGGRSIAGGRRTRRWTSALIVVEVALTLVLLAGAGFMVRSFLVLYGTDLGVDTSHLLTMSVYLPVGQYGRPALRAAFYGRLEQRLGGVSAIEASGLTTNYPLSGTAFVRGPRHRRAARAGTWKSAAGQDGRRQHELFRNDPRADRARPRADGGRCSGRARRRDRQSTLRVDVLPRRGSSRTAHHADRLGAAGAKVHARVGHDRRHRAGHRPTLSRASLPFRLSALCGRSAAGHVPRHSRSW